MRFFLVAVAALTVSLATTSAAQPSVQDSFARFPVTSIYRGPPVMPNFAGRDRGFRDFRTRIRNGIRQGPNFAGRYKVIQFGCGTGCSDVLVADVSSGHIYDFPRGGEDDQMLQLEYRISSNLIRTWWVPDIDNMNRCLQEDFVFKRGRFVSLGKPSPITCPTGYCENGVCK